MSNNDYIEKLNIQPPLGGFYNTRKLRNVLWFDTNYGTRNFMSNSQKWDVKDIYVGCSGNFTIERCLKYITSARLHSNDVTIYSCLIGRYLTGKNLNARLNPYYKGILKFVEKYLDDGAGTLAVILILSQMGAYFKSKPNPYYDRMINAYINQFFAGDYEKMFSAIDDMFYWNPPIFTSIDKNRILEMFEKLVKRKYFIFSTNDYISDFALYLAGICQTTNRGVPLYIYSKSQKARIVIPRQKTEPLLIPHLGAMEDIGDDIKLVKLKKSQFQALRSQYMSVYINPGNAPLALGVVIDNKLIGVYAVKIDDSLTNFNKYIDSPKAYLLSDFPIAPVKYKRLSKLVLYAALSKESRELIEALCNQRIYTLSTTAYSKKPVSMKYRGLFKLLKKDQFKGADSKETDISKIYYSTGYKLEYGAELGQWTLAEGLELWKKNHGKEYVK